ncbi:hypothetical protein Tco_0243362 [Tanacetum coccineum]
MEQDIDQDSICEQDDDLEDDQEDGDDRDTFDMWDITVDEEERIRQFLTPNVPESLNVTIVDEEADFNPTKDIEELEKLLAKDPQSHYMEIQVHSVTIIPEPFIYTQLVSPLYGKFKTSTSLTKPYNVDKDITSSEWYDFYSSFPYPIANLNPSGVYCYFHPHLIASEGMDTLLPSK